MGVEREVTYLEFQDVKVKNSRGTSCFFIDQCGKQILELADEKTGMYRGWEYPGFEEGEIIRVNFETPSVRDSPNLKKQSFSFREFIDDLRGEYRIKEIITYEDSGETPETHSLL